TIAYVTSPEDDHCAGYQVVDAKGMWIAPGLIDSHMHIESTHATPDHFANAVLPRGITTIAPDPHEIANVLGMEGVRYMLCAARNLPLRVLVLVPTCVPAVPHLETTGAYFSHEDVDALLNEPGVIGLAEVMDYWGVIEQSPRISEIVKVGRRRGAIITGHIRGLHGRELNTYLAAGIESDHEHLTAEGIRERTRLGMLVEIRCDNIEAAVDSWLERGYLENVVFVTDDIPPHQLVQEGHLDQSVRRAIALGMDPVEAVRAATLVPARRLHCYNLGALAPGWIADILVIKDLHSFEVHLTISSGIEVTKDGEMIEPLRSPHSPPPAALHSVRIDPPSPDDFVISASGNQAVAQVIAERGRKMQRRVLPVRHGILAWQEHSELALAMVWHRHGLNGNRAAALVSGSGLCCGALASTYAHDSHNLVVIGRNPIDMAVAVQALIQSGGGYVAVCDGQVLALVALPIAGILADRPVIELARDFRAFTEVTADLGVVDDPIGLLTSLALPVLPSYRLTDLGLVDVEHQTIIPAFEFVG
ncbi:MAG: adenine deaminase, partial [Anaerolineae bacterium]